MLDNSGITEIQNVVSEAKQTITDDAMLLAASAFAKKHNLTLQEASSVISCASVTRQETMMNALLHHSYDFLMKINV